MDSDRLEELIAGAALGELSADEARELAAAARDPTVARRIESMRGVMDLLAFEPPVRRPPAQLREATLLRARGERPRRAGLPRNWSVAWVGVSTLAAAAAVAAAIVLGFRMDDLQQSTDALTAELRAQQTTLATIYAERPRIISLEADEAAGEASARLMTTADGQQTILLVQGLHTPLPGRAYQLWLVRDDGQRVSGGVFRTDSAGRAVLLVRVGDSLFSFSAAGVTDEPAGGSPGPTGDRMLFGPVQ